MGRPTADWKHKGLSVAAWANDRGVTFTIQKRYKDKKTDQWKESKYLFPEDVKALNDLIGQALAWHYRTPMPSVQQLVSNVSAAASIPLKEINQLDDDEIPF